jgi:hypothetical protein
MPASCRRLVAAASDHPGSDHRMVVARRTASTADVWIRIAMTIPCVSKHALASSPQSTGGGKIVARAASSLAHTHHGLDLLGLKIIWR